jgi:hypothetical protein
MFVYAVSQFLTDTRAPQGIAVDDRDLIDNVLQIGFGHRRPAHRHGSDDSFLSQPFAHSFEHSFHVERS